jgi:VanZ family protein
MNGVRWIPVVLWAGFILTATSIPNVPAPAAPGTDKLAHVAMYAVFGVLALRAAWHAAPSPRTLVLTLAAIALFAAVDEWHQRFIPSRSADAVDWLADVAGATLGIGSLAVLKLRRVKGT